MTMGTILGAWIQPSGIWIVESEFDGGRHSFEITYDDMYIDTIYADTPEEIEDISARLNAEEDVREWDDGFGISLVQLLKPRTSAHRDILNKIKATDTIYIICDHADLVEILRKIENTLGTTLGDL